MIHNLLSSNGKLRTFVFNNEDESKYRLPYIAQYIDDATVDTTSRIKYNTNKLGCIYSGHKSVVSEKSIIRMLYNYNINFTNWIDKYYPPQWKEKIEDRPKSDLEIMQSTLINTTFDVTGFISNLLPIGSNTPKQLIFTGDTSQLSDTKYDLIICPMSLNKFNDVYPILQKLRAMCHSHGYIIIIDHDLVAGNMDLFLDYVYYRDISRSRTYRNNREWVQLCRAAGLRLHKLQLPPTDMDRSKDKLLDPLRPFGILLSP